MEPLEQHNQQEKREMQSSGFQESISSDQQCQKQEGENLESLRLASHSSTANDDVIDEKQQIRQPFEQQCLKQEQNLEEIIKEELIESFAQQSYIQDSNTAQQQHTGPKQQLFGPQQKLSESIQHDQSQIQPKIESKEKVEWEIKENLQKIMESEEKSTNVKNLIKSLSSTSVSGNKYLQPNSPELFTSPQSLLPNQVVCIENNSTRVITHMNKKIVPIPSSYSSTGGKGSLSPQKTRSTLPSVQSPYLLGKLIVTNYKIAYLDSLYPNTMTFCLPLNYILKIQRLSEQSTGISFIEITFKTGLSVKFKYHQEEFSYSQKIKDIIVTLLHKNIFAAVDFGEQQKNPSLKCKPYGLKYFDENAVRKSIKGVEAQIIENLNWTQMPGYPEKYVVPLRYIGKRNVETRIVVLSYVYSLQNEKVCLWRTGPGAPDPFEEEWIIKARTSANHYVMQIKNKGIGMLKSQATYSVEIQNLYLLRQSFCKVHQLTYHNHDSIKWLGNLCATKWYEQVATLMNEAQHIIQVMSTKAHVTLVCDTEARGAQMSALVQILMNPFYRTIEGFPFLLEKQFLQMGCPKASKKEREEDKSIILIQFLDCVFQFTHLYPLSFEFNQHYLVYIAQHVLSNKYGNFLYISRQLKKESDRREVVEKCVCIWEEIKRKIQTDKKVFFTPEQTQNTPKKVPKKSPSFPPIHELVNYYIYFRNSFYIDHNESNIFELRNHSEVSKGIKLWSSYFSKKVYACEFIKQQVLFCNQVEKRYFKIGFDHNSMKKSNESMRKKLSEQYSKIAEKRQILKNLKDL